jgi:hypothetical protein
MEENSLKYKIPYYFECTMVYDVGHTISLPTRFNINNVVAIYRDHCFLKFLIGWEVSGGPSSLYMGHKKYDGLCHKLDCDMDFYMSINNECLRPPGFCGELALSIF